MTSSVPLAFYDEEPTESHGEMIVYITAEILIAILAFFNNTFVIVAVCKYKHLRTRTYTLLACLAFADIGVALFAIPCAIILRIGLDLSDVPGSSAEPGRVAVDRNFCLLLVSSVLFLTQVSIFNLLIIAIDRFVAIYYSLRYRAIVTRFRVKLGIAGAWIFGALIGFLPQFGWKHFYIDRSNSTGSGRCAFEEVMSMDYMVYFNFFACVLLPLVIMFVLYILVFRSAKRQLRKIYSDVKIHRWKFSKSSLASIKESIQPTIKGAFSPLLMRLQRQSVAPPVRNGNRYETALTPLGNGRRDTTASEMLSFETTPLNERNDPLLGVNCSRISGMHRSSSTPTIPLIFETAPSNHVVPPSSSDPDVSPRRDLELPQTDTSAPFCPPYNQWTNQAPSTSGFTSAVSTLPRNDHSRRESSEIFEIGRLYSDASSIVASRTLEEGDREHGHHGRKMKRKSQLLRREFRAARSLFTVVGVFALCWLPLHVINCVTLFCPTCYTPAWLKDFAILLSHANSLVNPIIYAFNLTDMKQAFQTIIKEIWTGMTSISCCQSRKTI
uniref:Adenosine receptor A2a n=1 Tax=Phallusia mammillata TaxID=59560 RepID=A0A6F9D6H0_9ASCI|nr:adenosine receptor A2a [Phallusia mammillata]